MRITNVSTGSRYCSYAGNAGKTLMPGATTNELPFETIFHPNLKADLAANRCRIKLGDDDRAFLAWLMAEDTKKIEVAKPAPKNKKVQPAQKAEPKAAKPEAQAPAPVPEPKAVFLQPGVPKSIQDLKQHNQALKRAVIPGIPMNPGGATGQPVFGVSPDNRAAKLREASGLLGGRV